jgi:hypothetical protein
MVDPAIGPRSQLVMMATGVVMFLLGSGAAAADTTNTEGQVEPHDGQHHATYPNLFGLRVGYLSVIERRAAVTEYTPGLLAGASYERTLIHGWLEIEASVPVAVILTSDTIVALPIDAHLKIPFHPSPAWSPYVAAGPAMDVQVEPDTDVFFGASFAIGTYVWASDQVGIDVEVDYNIVVEDGEPVHEILVAVGPVVRF